MTTAIAPPPRTRNRRRTQRSAYLYILPALIVVVGIVYLGIGYNGWLSTLDWNGISPNPERVGFGNYLEIAADPIFWTAVGNVAVFGVIVIVVQMALGLAMALLLNGAVRGRGIYKVVMFMPVVLAPAAISTAFRQFYAENGIFNDILRFVGLESVSQAWLANPSTALYAIAVINIWQWTGFSFILYQAALSQLDENMFEAAQIDGASDWRIVRSIVIPQLRGTHATLALTGVIGALKTFDIVYLTTGGGPGRSTEFLTTYIYKQTVEQFHSGYAAALSMVLLVLALTLTVVQMRAYRFGAR
ncbi:MAG: sugar ABC transporter permease [Microbacterium sp.]|uniref:carbohydrate ABC transporter permease n=1 Tax=Microbacterium sp. TaxID=51671 RepID=UPI0039E38D4A